KRFETGQLVAARVYTRADMVRRWLRRNRVFVGTVAAAVGVLVVVGALGVAKIISERDRADTEMKFAIEERTSADAARERESMRVDQLTIAQARAQMDMDPTAALAWLKRMRPLPGNTAAAQSIAAEAYARSVARWKFTDRGPVADVAFSPVGGFLAVATET